MRAYEVDKDGDVIVNIVVPHESDALEAQLVLSAAHLERSSS